MRSGFVGLGVFLILVGSGCLKKDPLYCDENTPCTDPERPFCDLNGEFPASEGIKHTCIPAPADDGADAGPTRRVVDIALGPKRTCAILDDGGVRCWGKEALGYPDGVAPVGDDEHPFTVGDVPTGGPIREVALTSRFSCFLYESGTVRCVGDNCSGDLGYGHTDPVPATPEEAADLDLGEPARHIAGGFSHVCAVLESGALRCWGNIPGGGLGYQTLESTIGDDETPADMDPLDVGGAAVQVTAGGYFSCAILGGGDGAVRCWGMNATGQLGYGHTETVGDNEAPGSEGNVLVDVTEVVAVAGSTCALFVDGKVKCWGEGSDILGYSNLLTVGDDEEASVALYVGIGGVVEHLGGGPKCALLSDDSVRCWGPNGSGQLGTGNRETIGDDEKPVDGSKAMLDGPVERLARGFSTEHMCAVLKTGIVRCWGQNESGQLGLGYQENIGDDEPPSDTPPVRVLE